MLATRLNPLAEMNRLRSEMDRLFGRFGAAQPGGLAENLFPPLNLWEDGDNLYVEAELPGFELSEMEIYVTGGNQLSIRGQRKQPELQNGVWQRRERDFGSFSRMIELPTAVDSDKVAGHFKHGVLTITLPKSEAAKPRRIEVRKE